MLSDKGKWKGDLLWNSIYFIGLVLIIGAEQIYRQPLLDWSKDIMLSIQNSETDAGRITFITLSLIGLGVPYVSSILILLVFNSQRGRSFYHLLFLGAALFVMSVTKMAYAEPRMFWVVQGIRPDECTAEYGNPSGHTLLAIGYPMMLYLDIFENKKRQQTSEESMSWL